MRKLSQNEADIAILGRYVRLWAKQEVAFCNKQRADGQEVKKYSPGKYKNRQKYNPSREVNV